MTPPIELPLLANYTIGALIQVAMHNCQHLDHVTALRQTWGAAPTGRRLDLVAERLFFGPPPSMADRTTSAA